ncbi:hypothetical protein FIBSPDRAFT_935846 [Athelia psychrophila]|uniref:Uncharacterized protein n=1 Tax=Athelia psychrophila TaxID=1759441 RepID=A0A166D5H9_9AGAM|nr:hypothetical protein FIBSPDRAFT_935846 [Fibularhizoctonia sp. CBS 109695]
MYIYYVYAYLTNNVKTVHALFLELWFRFKQLFWGRASLLEWGMGAGARGTGSWMVVEDGVKDEPVLEGYTGLLEGLRAASRNKYPLGGMLKTEGTSNGFRRCGQRKSSGAESSEFRTPPLVCRSDFRVNPIRILNHSDPYDGGIRHSYAGHRYVIPGPRVGALICKSHEIAWSSMRLSSSDPRRA